MNKALIISASVKNLDITENIVKSVGYNKITFISNGNEARRLLNFSDYELIIINTPLPDEFGHELSIALSEISNAGIILICKNDIADDISEKISGSGVLVVQKPLNRQLLRQSILLVLSNQTRMLGIKKENINLMNRIDDIRLINRAKSTLMQYLKFTEPQAHRYIEKQAMNNRQTRREVAMRILAAYKR